MDRSTAVSDNSNVKSLSMYERVLGLLYNNYVRAQVEFMYQIDQLTSRVKSMESCKKMKEPGHTLFNCFSTNFEEDMEIMVILA